MKLLTFIFICYLGFVAYAIYDHYTKPHYSYKHKCSCEENKGE